MSIFGAIMDKIFHAASSALEPGAQTGQTTPASPASSPAPGFPVTASTAQPAAAPASSGTAAGASAGAAAQPVDVEAVLQQMAAQKGGGGNWKTSIVDLLKLLDLDSSLDARKQLASELSVHVGADGTAEENVALHKAVMQKLAENGGHVPDSLKG